MNALALIQAFARRTGLSAPSTLELNPDDQVLQFLGLLSEVLEDLAEFGWEQLRVLGELITVDGEDQGELLPQLPAGFRCFVNDTFYDATTGQYIYGSELPQTWALLHSSTPGGIFPTFRLLGGSLFLSPAPGAGHRLTFEVLTSFAVKDVFGQLKPAVTADTDTFLFPESLLLAGLRYKWKYEKGLEYAEDLRRFEILRLGALSHNTPKPVRHLDGEGASAVPGIIVPPGSWKLP